MLRKLAAWGTILSSRPQSWIKSRHKLPACKELSNCHSRPECQETHLICYVNCLQNPIHISPTKIVLFLCVFFFLLDFISTFSYLICTKWLKRLLPAPMVIFFQREPVAHLSLVSFMYRGRNSSFEGNFIHCRNFKLYFIHWPYNHIKLFGISCWFYGNYSCFQFCILIFSCLFFSFSLSFWLSFDFFPSYFVVYSSFLLKLFWTFMGML